MRSANWRATASTTPPAENGTTSLIGRSGYFAWANAGSGASADAERAMPPLRISRLFIGPSACGL
jgi:hypothetical protein